MNNSTVPTPGLPPGAIAIALVALVIAAAVASTGSAALLSALAFVYEAIAKLLRGGARNPG